MLKKNPMLLMVLSLLFILSGCNNIVSQVLQKDTPEMVIQKSIEAQDKVHSMELTINNEHDSKANEVVLTVDYETNEGNYELLTDGMLIYFSDEHVIAEYDDGTVEEMGDTVADEIMEITAADQNPLKAYMAFDDSFHQYVDMKKEKGQYHFSFNGSETEQQKFGELLLGYEEEMSDLGEAESLHINDLKLDFTVNTDTYLIETMNMNIAFESGETGNAEELTNDFVYDNYNKKGLITELSSEDVNSESPENTAQSDLDDKEAAVLEDEASAYVDALILATVFQDEKGFIEKAPESMSKEDKESEAKLQKDYFKEIYAQNTKANMEGLEVTDEEIDNLTNAFLGALKNTSYKIAGAKLQSDEEVIVTVSVEGIDDQKIYADTEDEINKVIKEGKIKQDELISKNIEILANQYKAVRSTLDPVDVDVHVYVDNGQLLVLQQDEYLAGFVQ